jgi:hypothetical protein
VREDPVWTPALLFFLSSSGVDESYADRLLVVNLVKIVRICPDIYIYIYIYIDPATKSSVRPSLRLPSPTPVLSTKTRVYQPFLGTQLYAERADPSPDALVEQPPPLYSMS